jgi:hypothetical protein
MIVEVNGQVLKGADTTYATYSGNNNSYTLGLDPLESGGTILPSNIKVYINGILQQFVVDYIFDGPTKIITIYPKPIEALTVTEQRNLDALTTKKFTSMVIYGTTIKKTQSS